MSIREDRPDKAWRRALVGVSLDIDKFVKVPSGKILFPFKFEPLKSSVEDISGSFCIGLKATYSDEVFNTFFGNPNVHAGQLPDCNVLSQSATDPYRGDFEFKLLHDIDRHSVDYSGCSDPVPLPLVDMI